MRLANVEIHQLLHHGSTRHATTFVIIVTVKWQHRDLIEGRLNVNERKESTYFPVCAINQSIIVITYTCYVKLKVKKENKEDTEKYTE